MNTLFGPNIYHKQKFTPAIRSFCTMSMLKSWSLFGSQFVCGHPSNTFERETFHIISEKTISYAKPLNTKILWNTLKYEFYTTFLQSLSCLWHEWQCFVWNRCNIDYWKDINIITWLNTGRILNNLWSA